MKVLVTGAGGAAAVTVLQRLAPHAALIAADIDPYAVGLHLVPPDRRVLLPRGDDPGFAEALHRAALAYDVDLVVPTVDAELPAVARRRDEFAADGIVALVEGERTLAVCGDKLHLVRACDGVVRVPTTQVLGVLTDEHLVAELGLPLVVKPRRGAGGRGVHVVCDLAELARLPHDGSQIAQELLPGTEYSIDVLARPDGRVVAAVPRTRDKVDSGIAVAGRVVRDAEVEELARTVARTIGARFVVNIQARRDSEGRCALLEVNPRFPGTMALTVAAGIDMPLLAVRSAFGDTLPDSLPYTEVAMVRHWHNVVVPVAEYALERSPIGV